MWRHRRENIAMLFGQAVEKGRMSRVMRHAWEIWLTEIIEFGVEIHHAC
jgi:hypothetical protein